MFKITQKLRSRRGASLILAMVFILMCLFVGGSVLAAATANGGRVADLTSNQQAYLSQRSAALLMADMLKGDGNSNLQLTIKQVSESSGSGDPTVNTIYTLSGAAAPTNLQRILVENALRNYHIFKTPGTEDYNGFTFPEVTSDEIYATANAELFPSNNGTFTITEPNGTELKATFVTPTPPQNLTDMKSEHFDLRIDFGTGSQISLYVKATYSEGNPIEVTQNGITTTTTTTVIRWDDPVIEKGGFSS